MRKQYSFNLLPPNSTQELFFQETKLFSFSFSYVFKNLRCQFPPQILKSQKCVSRKQIIITLHILFFFNSWLWFIVLKYINCIPRQPLRKIYLKKFFFIPSVFEHLLKWQDSSRTLIVLQVFLCFNVTQNSLAYFFTIWNSRHILLISLECVTEIYFLCCQYSNVNSF